MDTREAWRQLKAAGAVGVMDVTVTPADVCRDCGDEITYVAFGAPGVRYDDSGWRHVSTGLAWGGDGKATLANHMAAPVPHCPDCGGRDYRFSETPYGSQWDCGSCGRHDYFSIGD